MGRGPTAYRSRGLAVGSAKRFRRLEEQCKQDLFLAGFWQLQDHILGIEQIVGGCVALPALPPDMIMTIDNGCAELIEMSEEISNCGALKGQALRTKRRR